MPDNASELARRLARNAEVACRHHLPAGRREGRYWLVGDVQNTPGRSLYVRLTGPESGKGAARKWTDARSGQHGDLLDLIASREHLTELRDMLDEARRFLSLPQPNRHEPMAPVPQGSPEAARRLFAMAKSIRGAIAETHLHSCGITDLRDGTALRFHPHCFYRPDKDDAPGVHQAWPALLAAVTDPTGTITGVHRTRLTPDGSANAPVATPRRSLGLIQGYGVRIGRYRGILDIGEAVETLLSLRTALPAMPGIAAGSANHLDALILPTGCTDSTSSRITIRPHGARRRR